MKKSKFAVVTDYKLLFQGLNLPSEVQTAEKLQLSNALTLQRCHHSNSSKLQFNVCCNEDWIGFLEATPIGAKYKGSIAVGLPLYAVSPKAISWEVLSVFKQRCEKLWFDSLEIHLFTDVAAFDVIQEMMDTPDKVRVMHQPTYNDVDSSYTMGDFTIGLIRNDCELVPFACSVGVRDLMSSWLLYKMPKRLLRTLSPIDLLEEGRITSVFTNAYLEQLTFDIVSNRGATLLTFQPAGKLFSNKTKNAQ